SARLRCFFAVEPEPAAIVDVLQSRAAFVRTDGRESGVEKCSGNGARRGRIVWHSARRSELRTDLGDQVGQIQPGTIGQGDPGPSVSDAVLLGPAVNQPECAGFSR